MMWFIHLALLAVVLYAAVIAGVYFAQTWLLFPTTFVAGQVTLPTSAQRLEVSVPCGDLLVGVRVPASSGTGQARPLLLGFGGNAWNADVMAVYLHGLVPDHDVVAFHYRGYRPSTGRPSADALLADAHVCLPQPVSSRQRATQRACDGECDRCRELRACGRDADHPPVGLEWRGVQGCLPAGPQGRSLSLLRRGPQPGLQRGAP